MARVHAAPDAVLPPAQRDGDAAAIDLALRYADVLTGADLDAASASGGDDDTDEPNDVAHDVASAGHGLAAARAAAGDGLGASSHDDSDGERVLELAERLGAPGSDPPLPAAADGALTAGDAELGAAAAPAILGGGVLADGALPLAVLDEGLASEAASGELAGDSAALLADDVAFAAGDLGPAVAGEAGSSAADAGDLAASSGGAELSEQWARQRRPSRWSRVDLGIAWQRRWTDPRHARPTRHDELWLVATWRP